MTHIQTYYGYQYIIFVWVLFAVQTCFVFVRVYVELRIRYRPWREILVVMAWLWYLGFAICVSLMNDWDFYNIDAVNFRDFSDAALRPVEQAKVAQWFFFHFSQYAVEAAFLCFYNSLTPRRVYRKTWWLISVAWFILAADALVCLLYTFLTCHPFYLLWSHLHETCWYNLRYYMTTLALDAIASVLVYSIPFVILHNIKTLQAEQKRVAYLVFGLYAFNVIFVLVALADIVMRFITRTRFSTPYFPHCWYAMMLFLNPVRQLLVMVALCLPQVRRLWLGLSGETIQGENANLRASMSQMAILNGSRGGLGFFPREENIALGHRKQDSEGSISVENLIAISPGQN